VTASSRPEAPLPVRPRPRHGETADSYLRRLAAVNHLRFSYLRLYVAARRGSYDRVDAARLAALAGREPHAILQAFPELGPAVPGPATRRYPQEEVERNREARRERYAAIRRDAEAGFSQRAIMARQHVGRRTIALALASEEPPERKKIHRESAALNGLHAIIDVMIDDNPAIGTAVIWQRLADDHGATIAYPTLRAYVVSRRTAQPRTKLTETKPLQGHQVPAHALIAAATSSQSRSSTPGRRAAQGNLR
jgi:hypothetical protein